MSVSIIKPKVQNLWLHLLWTSSSFIGRTQQYNNTAFVSKMVLIYMQMIQCEYSQSVHALKSIRPDNNRPCSDIRYHSFIFSCRTRKILKIKNMISRQMFSQFWQKLVYLPCLPYILLKIWIFKNPRHQMAAILKIKMFM